MSEPYYLRCWTRFYASPEEVRDAMRTMDERDNAASLSNKFCGDWEHEQIVESASDATRFLDVVTFTTQTGPPRVMRRLVLELFLRRHRHAARLLPTDRRATAVAVMRAVDLELD